MAHQLTTRANGKTEMAYVGEVPWHRLGQELQAGASIEQWIEAAGFDWKVQRSKIRYATDRASGVKTWDDMHVLFRSDTKAPLGVVSDAYQIVQPKQVMEFFRDMVATAGFQIETAGTLFGGRRYWAMAKITQAIFEGWDQVGGYCLLTTSCDGSSKTDAFGTSQRVVCNNTLSMAFSGAKSHRVTMSHKSVFDEKSIKAKMGLCPEQFEAFTQAIRTLTKAKVTTAAADQFVRQLLRVEAAVNDPKAKPHNGEATILSLFSGKGKGSTLPGSAGTAWGLVNAVTEYIDHVAPRKSDDHRFFQSLLGAGDTVKTDALELALKTLVGA